MYLALTMIHPRSSLKNGLRSSGLVEIRHFYVFIDIRSPQTIDFTWFSRCLSPTFREEPEKRGSRYLRYALINAAKYVCLWDPTFGAYLAKKRSEGKHYNVAITHAAKKLVRLIYAMEKSGKPYIKAA